MIVCAEGSVELPAVKPAAPYGSRRYNARQSVKAATLGFGSRGSTRSSIRCKALKKRGKKRSDHEASADSGPREGVDELTVRDAMC